MIAIVYLLLTVAAVAQPSPPANCEIGHDNNGRCIANTEQNIKRLAGEEDRADLNYRSVPAAIKLLKQSGFEAMIKAGDVSGAAKAYLTAKRGER